MPAESPASRQTTDFFISYTSSDRAWAVWLAWQLEEAGYTTTLQAWDFLPGTNFVLEMQRAAEHAQRIIAVLSPAFLEASYTQPEWAAALARDPTGEHGRLLPVRVFECKPAGLLSQIVYIDLVGLDEVAAKRDLLEKVRRERLKPTAAPRFPGAAESPAQEEPEYPPGPPSVATAPPNTTVRYADVNNDGDPELFIQYFVGAHGSAAMVFHYHRRLFELRLIAELRSGTPNGFTIEDVDGDGKLEVVAIEADTFASPTVGYAGAPRMRIVYRWNSTVFEVVDVQNNQNAAQVTEIRDHFNRWVSEINSQLPEGQPE